MHHALGLNWTKDLHRNHFIADADGDDASQWRELVAKGWATEEIYKGAENARLFRVTGEGKKLVLEHLRKAAKIEDENHR